MKLRNDKGFTLVELVLSLGLLLIVLVVGYMFFSFGTNTFAEGEKQSNVQRDIRLACGEITRELRNVTGMAFVDAASPAAGNYNYIIFDSAGKTIKVFDKNANQIYETNPCIDSFTYLFETVNGKYVMKFTVNGTEGGRSFSTESKVYLVNLDSAPDKYNEGYNAIKYIKP